MLLITTLFATAKVCKIPYCLPVKKLHKLGFVHTTKQTGLNRLKAVLQTILKPFQIIVLNKNSEA